MSDAGAATTLCERCRRVAPRLNDDGWCPDCEEAEARAEAALGALVTELADNVFSILGDYLHPSDLRDLLDANIGWRAELLEGEGAHWAPPERIEDRRIRLARLTEMPATNPPHEGTDSL
jgi:hypothetical protein